MALRAGRAHERGEHADVGALLLRFVRWSHTRARCAGDSRRRASDSSSRRGRRSSPQRELPRLPARQQPGTPAEAVAGMWPQVAPVACDGVVDRSRRELGVALNSERRRRSGMSPRARRHSCTRRRSTSSRVTEENEPAALGRRSSSSSGRSESDAIRCRGAAPRPARRRSSRPDRSRTNRSPSNRDRAPRPTAPRRGGVGRSCARIEHATVEERPSRSARWRPRTAERSQRSRSFGDHFSASSWPVDSSCTSESAYGAALARTRHAALERPRRRRRARVTGARARTIARSCASATDGVREAPRRSPRYWS